MKSKIVITLALLRLLAGIYSYIGLPDYHVTNSMSFSNQDTRDTRLSVTVYKYWGINDTIQEIEAEHNRINGTLTTLEINLYYPAWFPLDDSEPFKTVMIELLAKRQQRKE